MKYVVDSKQMRTYDSYTSSIHKIPSIVLMERAALEFVDILLKEREGLGKCLVVCGTGNNGGDGIAIARLLLLRGVDVSVFYAGDVSKVTEQNSLQRSIAESYDVPVVHNMKGIISEEWDTVIDAIFGVGMSREISGSYRELIENLNTLCAYKVAVDIPSGISADTGCIMGVAFKADITVTFGFDKIGLLLYPGAELAGKVILSKDIGINEKSIETPPRVFTLEKEDIVKWLPKRRPGSNKGTYGKVFLVAGSKNMAGAAIFAAQAAYHAGCGLVKILTVEQNRTILQQAVPQAILETYQEEDIYTDVERFKDKLRAGTEWSNVCAIGPGLGTGKTAEKIVEWFMHNYGGKLVIDADALNILSIHPEWLIYKKCDCAMTPHLKEMERMCKSSVQEIKKDLIGTATSFSEKYSLNCVLKDASTITVMSNGTSCINSTGNSGMSVGGSGDVLTGIIAGIIAQGMATDKAAALGVLIHGMAGDLAATEVGEYAMQPQDIIRNIGRVIKSV